MTRHEAAVAFIRLRDMLDETVAAGLDIPHALGVALSAARSAYDELTWPKPDIARDPIVIPHQTRKPADDYDWGLR